MKKYLVEFMNTNEYEFGFTKLVEAEESEIMDRVADFHVEAIKGYLHYELKDQGLDYSLIDDEDLDAKIRECLEEMPQGFDFYPYQKDEVFSAELEEKTCYAPDGSTRYVELTDEEAALVESWRVEGQQQFESSGIYFNYDSKQDSWDGWLMYMLPELGWVTEEVVDKLKSLKHPLDDGALEDYLADLE